MKHGVSTYMHVYAVQSAYSIYSDVFDVLIFDFSAHCCHPSYAIYFDPFHLLHNIHPFHLFQAIQSYLLLFFPFSSPFHSSPLAPNSDISSPLFIQRPTHRHPPTRTILPHGPHHRTARHSNDTNTREKPAVTNRAEERFGDKSADAGDDVADEIVGGDAGGGFSRHEFGQHRGCHAEDEHGPDAEEEV